MVLYTTVSPDGQGGADGSKDASESKWESGRRILDSLVVTVGDMF